MLFFLLSTSFAAEYTDTLTRAKSALQKKQYGELEPLLLQAETEATTSKKIVDPKNLINIWHYRAIAAYQKGAEPMALWRTALVLHPQQDWDKTLFNDKKASELFYAIKTEVEYRNRISPFIPDQYGLAKLYVDGVEVSKGDTVLEGKHLLQIQCPKGDVYGKWSDLSTDPNWIGMCPYQFDVEEKGEEDLFSMDGLEEELAVPETTEVEEETESTPSEETEEEATLKPSNYFDGLNVTNVTQTEHLYGGLSLGTITTGPLIEANIDVYYRIKDRSYGAHLGTGAYVGAYYIVNEEFYIGPRVGYHLLLRDPVAGATVGYEYTLQKDLLHIQASISTYYGFTYGEIHTVFLTSLQYQIF
ncbi:MAG: hypothetical protein VX278_06170 [Myxococcota bacterium]|nr:hypothetical protein [Myxococcota bacterium]